MSSSRCSPPGEEEEVGWTNKQGLWLNIVVKEENEEEDVTVKAEDEALELKGGETEEKREEDGLDVKDEREITFTLKEEDDVQQEIRGESPDTQSNSKKSPSGEPDPETPPRHI
ncbi:hypothetical protein UPYG_G00058800 [Umbra pygmaea]|uniref:Uncharacterized protein n=1 Tax=Umbra pygmaea TaxID=75934 RepID=A0ABD0X8V7_UMBPY